MADASVQSTRELENRIIAEQQRRTVIDTQRRLIERIRADKAARLAISHVPEKVEPQVSTTLLSGLLYK